MIIPFENEIRILKYMPIHKLFIVGSGSGFIKDLVLYDTSGEYNSTIKVPSNVFAVYSIENAVGSEIIRIGYYTEIQGRFLITLRTLWTMPAKINPHYPWNGLNLTYMMADLY